MKFLTRTKGLIAVAVASTMMLSACSATSEPAAEADANSSDVIEIRYGSWQSGAPPVSNMFTHFLEENEDLQAKHGIDFSDESYTNLQALYTDLAQGRIQAVSAGPASMAANAAQGAPVRLAGLSARSTASILSNGKGWSADELRGSRLVAPTGTSTWSDVQAQIEETFGLVPGDYELVSTQDLASPITQLAAGTADYAMTWGEHIPRSLERFPNVKVVADPQQLAGDGKPFWQFSITVHESVSDEGAKRMLAAASEVADWMMENPDEVEAWAVSQGQDKGVARSLIEDGLQTFEYTSVTPEVRTELENNFQALIEMGKMSELPPESYWGN